MSKKRKQKQYICSHCRKLFWNRADHFYRFCSFRNENSFNWKGGIYDKIMSIRRSRRYKEWAKKVKERDDWTCWICEKRGGILQSHHLKNFANYEELRFKESNGLTLCRFCHTLL